MITRIKGFIFKWLGVENYLWILQRGYFFAYKTGVLKRNAVYYWHYFAKSLIKKGDVVIDIGANLGYYSILFAQWTGRSGKVFSVEPIRIYNQIFNEKAKRYDNITLYPYALGTEERTVELVYSSQTGVLNTGLPHIYDPQKDGNIDKQQFAFEAQMKIPSVLFGDLERIDYIKCDIEGFEYIVLSDMKEIIRKCRPKVQVEIWSENAEKLIQMFDELGYTPYKLDKNRLVSLKEGGDRLPGDCLFIPS